MKDWPIVHEMKKMTPCGIERKSLRMGIDVEALEPRVLMALRVVASAVVLPLAFNDLPPRVYLPVALPRCARPSAL